jgi:hypothetical protein
MVGNRTARNRPRGHFDVAAAEPWVLSRAVNGRLDECARSRFEDSARVRIGVVDEERMCLKTGEIEIVNERAP